MCDVVYHRGPNDRGFFLDANIGLGNQRLSIIDLTGGHQPVHNEDESVWVVFNGEIYNYIELKQYLEKLGHRFYTSCDTEVIVHLYEEFGDFCVKELRGMFAFAIWDSDKEKLLLARDRLGIKPLYYTIFDGNLLFGSETKSILQYEEVIRDVNHESLHHFLTFRYVPGSETMFKGIKKLLPAHVMSYENGRILISQYWNLNMTFYPENTETYYSEQLREHLRESVKSHLISDVPLGAYLSGGLDSSSIVGLMSLLVDEPVKTFSVGFGAGEPVDELRYAQIVADHFGTDHHEFIVQSNTVKLLPEIIWHLDEPVADAATIPTYLLSEKARKYVTVILIGEGADELFAGYLSYKVMLMGERYHRLIPSFVKSKIFSKLAAIAPELSELKWYLNFASVSEDKVKSYLTLISTFSEEEKKELYSNDFRHRVKGLQPSEKTVKPYFEGTDTLDFINQMLLLDIKTWMPDDLLTKVDKMTMAHSVEARVPFLDHKVVEFSGTIPPNLKLKGLTEKYILRKSMYNILPKTIIKRKKHAFNPPINTWLKENELKEIASQFLSESFHNREYFDSVYVRHILRHHQKSKSNRLSQQIWSLLTLEFWHRIYIDNNNIGKPRLSLNDLY